MRKTILTAAVAAVVGAVIATPIAVYASHGFNDVPDSNTFHEDIAWLAEAAVTRGCNPPDNTEFCPDDDVTREQMAAFMRRFAQYLDAEDGTPAQADNAQRLQGNRASDFAMTGHDHLNESWNGTGPGLSVTADSIEAANAPIVGINNSAGSLEEEVAGVYGQVDTDEWCTLCFPPNATGVLGRNLDNGVGVTGVAGGPLDEVWKPVGAYGVVGLGHHRGVYASSHTAYGSYSTSLQWYGMYGRTSRTDNDYGIYTPDNLHAAGSITTSSMATVMQNSGDQTLQPGDVVAFSGAGDPLVEDGEPTAAVSLASIDGDANIAGVVTSAFDPEAANLDPATLDDSEDAPDPTPDGPIGPGSYAVVTILGPAQVNMGGSGIEQLTSGDPVTISATPGSVIGLTTEDDDSSTDQATQTPFGRFLGSADDSGKVWIFIEP